MRAQFVVMRAWELGLLEVVDRKVCKSVMRDRTVVLC